MTGPIIRLASRPTTQDGYGIGDPATSYQSIQVNILTPGYDGTRFTDDTTGHGMFVSVENVYSF
jgi:hypothetical protein